ncbi:MAG TPA: hypothetical protein PKD85_09955 [Saprospiraceae bacterium]|nr:hypothetical protein [Saprospiraceae bacterium]
MLGFFAESAEFLEGKFIFHGIRVDFAPSEKPHFSLLENSNAEENILECLSPEDIPEPLLPEKDIPEDLPQVQILETEEDDIIDDILDDMFEDDGGLSPMDLSDD